MTPFLKWAGGKRWLTKSYSSIFPQKFDTYLEPFLGSGAVFFNLRPEKAVLSDANIELIHTYEAIKTNYKLVVRYLNEHNRQHSTDYYYKIRAQQPKSIFRRAARLIYLNRTCWNALYRVNKRGEFNVPIGTKSSVRLPTDNFSMTSKLLSSVKLCHSDFESLVESSKDGDFIFADPPYTVKHNLNGFVKYNERIFSWKDQIRLRDSLYKANERGVKFLLTNANHHSIKKIYKSQFNLRTLNRQSILAASPSYRSKTSELIITNY